ncbi:MAG: methylated-DNA--[protein]-cysteine S-methyltransferase [Actinomycetaceae bacterium]|nr:methylated-DNA--[protein]-cysteine S-methyltransferase [Actinomycetaceae bacterium]
MKRTPVTPDMLKYVPVDSPVGRIWVGASPRGVARIWLPGERPCGVLENTEFAELARTQLTEYFALTRRTFTVPLAIPEGAFRADVWRGLAQIPYGKTVSYKDLAEVVGRAKAVRAVASACATNPVAILLPCHRVIYSTGEVGNYRGGAWMKKKLLLLEGANIREEA